MTPGSNSFMRVVCIAGLVSLLHCAYSAAQHRSYIRLTQQPFTQLPLDLVAQTLISLFLVVYSASYIAGDFQPIRADLQNRTKSWDSVGNCPSFYIFDHRAKSLSPEFRGLKKECYDDPLELKNLLLSFGKLPSKSSFAGSVRCFSSCQFFLSSFPSGRESPMQTTFSSKNLKEAYNYCVEIVRKRDYPNYVATLLMLPSVRPQLLALNVEVSLVRDRVIRNSGTADIYRLQFWKDTLNSIYGKDQGLIPRQPVAMALKTFLPKSDLSELQNLVSARQGTLGDRQFSSVDAVKAYGTLTYGSVMSLIMSVLAQNVNQTMSPDAKKAAELLGEAMGLLTLLRSTYPLLARGIVLLPPDLLKTHGLTPDSLYRKKEQETIRALAKDISQQSEHLLLEARSLRNKVPVPSRDALLSNGSTLDYLLRTLQKSNYDLFDIRLQRNCELLAWRLWWRHLRKAY